MVGNINEGVLLVLASTAFLVCTVFVVTAIITAVKMVFKWSARKALFYNAVVKFVYLPIHVVLIFVALGMGNPFLFMFMFVPVVISIMLLCATGVIAVAGIIRGYYEKKYKLSTAIIFSILSFWGICDMVVAMLAYQKAKKETIYLAD